MPKCKRCSDLYAIIQQIREINANTKSNLNLEKASIRIAIRQPSGKKISKFSAAHFINTRIDDILFRLDFIADLCEDADKT